MRGAPQLLAWSKKAQAGAATVQEIAVVRFRSYRYMSRLRDSLFCCWRTVDGETNIISSDTDEIQHGQKDPNYSLDSNIQAQAPRQEGCPTQD